jgi:hypothetical protein
VSEHQIRKLRRAGFGAFESNHERQVGLVLAVSAGLGIYELRLRILELQGCTLLVQLFLRAVTAVGFAGSNEHFGGCAIMRFAVALEVGGELAADLGTLVPVESEPVQGVQDRAYALETAPLLIRVFDAQDELTPLIPGPQPAEQGRSGSANMQVSAGGWRKAQSHGHGAPEYHLGFAASPAPRPFRLDRGVLPTTPGV